ncbi:OmpA family protein [Flavobacterium sp. Arc3]|uniref:OmpA family protein n=1 Tax=unclassified Flavobacterium TaxID=196869 RepID=UPI00352E1BFB
MIGFTCINGVVQAQQEKSPVSKNQTGVVEDGINSKIKEINFNRWSLSINGGFNVPVGPFTKGYYSAATNYINHANFNHLDINVRKMFNTKFGLMWGLGYDSFSNVGRSIPFNNNMYSTSLQGVVNVHRALNWEKFTNTFGLQLHFGSSFSFLDSHLIRAETSTYKDKALAFDNIYGVISGATVIIKVSDRLAFNVDYSMMKNFSHNLNLDGRTEVDLGSNRTGVIHNTTAGITFYLGNKDKHADWYWERKVDCYEELLTRINTLESKLKDSNNDGIPDGMETVIKAKFDNLQNVNNAISGDVNFTKVEARNMINSQYVNVFFDFDESRISTGTISAINFLIKYLNDNPTAKVDVIGYADELGNTDYNFRLSETRAKNVAEMIIRSGIDASRLTVITKGEDNSVPKESSIARQLVRRVVFKVN